MMKKRKTSKTAKTGKPLSTHKNLKGGAKAKTKSAVTYAQVDKTKHSNKVTGIKKAGKPGKTKNFPGLHISKLSKAQLVKIIERQHAQDKQDKLAKRAALAVRQFRARKSDKGKIVFIGTKGNRDAATKGRKGYTVFVDKSGKKHLVKDYKTGLRPNKLAEINLPLKKNLKKATQEFIESRRKILETKKALVKSKGEVKPKGQYDFSDKIVTKIAGSLKKAFGSQMSQRRFLMNANVLIRKPNGETRLIRVQVPISKPDHIAIEIGGMENFVRQKFYAHLAKQLAFDGYVTSGSANHVRRLGENAGEDRDDWTKDGQVWEGHDYETVKIEQIEWQIEQLQ
jgi:hypothetical protein